MKRFIAIAAFGLLAAACGQDGAQESVAQSTHLESTPIWTCEGYEILGPDMTTSRVKAEISRAGYDQKPGVWVFVNVYTRLDSNTARPSQWQTKVEAAEGRLFEGEGKLTITFTGGSIAGEVGNSGITGTLHNYRGSLELDGEKARTVTCVQ